MCRTDKGELGTREGWIVEVAEKVVVVVLGSSNKCVRIGVRVDLCQWELVFDSKNDVAMYFRCRKCTGGCFELDLDGESVYRLRSGITGFGREF